MNPTPSSAPVSEIAPETLDRLRAQLRGPLLRPGDPGYEDSRTVWNAMIQRHPALVVRCLGVSDVIAGVRFAREQGLTLCIKGGGHNIAGLATCDGGLMLDLSLMRGVMVDPQARIARAQGGCLLGDVDRETQLHGLAATLGFVSNTGIGGLTVGGGFGYLSRRFGWTSDTVTEMEVVTAEGRIVRASEKENADLFWGLRGGGGNFGIVTRFDYRLEAVGPEIVGGAIAWRDDKAAEAFELQRQIMADAPPELALVSGFRKAPPAPWIAKEAHGQGIVLFALCHTGRLEDGERVVERIRSIPGAVGDTLQRRPYVTQQALLDATQPKGRRYYWKSEYTPDLNSSFLDKALPHARAATSIHSAVLLFPIGDAVAKLPDDHSAVGNRDARWVFNVAAAWEKPEEDATHVEWARAAWRDLRAFSTGGVYVNFLTEEESDDRIQSAYRTSLTRLVEIKRRWDPDNLFRMNKNIRP
jgi:FAD/FMN-containing dehydrogenase